jgi:hypothetical protein
MEPIRIVIRLADGRVIKGFTNDFSPDKDSFHVRPVTDDETNPSVKVFINDLKAVFFVRNFSGSPDYQEAKEFPAVGKPLGRKVSVTFLDGEVLVGTTMTIDSSRPGFFIHPVDPKSNNLRVFVISKAVLNLDYL